MDQPRPPRRFLPVLVGLGAVALILIGLHLAAPFLTPTLFALLFSVLFAPVYAWLQRRGLPRGASLLLVLLLQVAVFGAFFVVVSVSLSQFTAQLATYALQLDGRLAALRGQAPGDALVWLPDGDVLMALLGRLAADLAAFLGRYLYIQVLLLFCILEGPAIVARLRASLGADHPQVAHLPELGQGVVRQFGLRAVVNAVTAAAITVWLLLLGVDFPVLWGVLTFFLSYIPYIGIVVATVPSVVLAFAEYGAARALLVIVGVAVADLAAENVLSPMLTGRGLRMSPTALFVAFAFWTWLLGMPGAFIGVPLTLFLMVTFATFPGTRWLAALMTADPPAPAEDAGAEGA